MDRKLRNRILLSQAQTPALPPAPGRAKFDFAACDPFLPIPRGPTLRTLQDARTHPSGAAFLLHVRGLLDPCPIGVKSFHSSKSSAAFSRFLAGVVYSAHCPLHPFLESVISHIYGIRLLH